MNGKISRLYFAVFFSYEVLSKKNRWFMADSLPSGEIWNDAENISERVSSGNVFTVYVGRQIDRTSECCGR